MKTLMVILRKEFRQFFASSFLPRLCIFFPLMVMLLMPLVANMEVKNVGVAIVDNDMSTLSRNIVQSISSSQYTNIADHSQSYDQAINLISKAKADVILEIPYGFENSLLQSISQGASGKNISPLKLNLSANAVNASKGALGMQYLQQIIGQEIAAYTQANRSVTQTQMVAKKQMEMETSAHTHQGKGIEGTQTSQAVTSLTMTHAQPRTQPQSGSQEQPKSQGKLGPQGQPEPQAQAQPGAQAQPKVEFQVSTLNMFNPTLNYRYFMIPALMIMLLVMLCGFLPALNIVGEKERGTIEQINVSPISQLTFTLGKVVPYWIIGFVVITIAVIVSRLVYGLWPLGNIGLIYLASFLFFVVMSSLAAFMANFSDNMQQVMLVMFFIVMLSILMSGMLTPITSMPNWAQNMTYAIPPRYYVDIMRAVYLRGATISDLWAQFALLGGFATLFTAVAIFTYRKRQ